MLSNLGIAAVYSALGQFAQSQGELAMAIVASIALPLAAATMARWLMPR
jgi:ABC-type proline/glycine betaine transport system permease subunit